MLTEKVITFIRIVLAMILLLSTTFATSTFIQMVYQIMSVIFAQKVNGEKKNTFALFLIEGYGNGELLLLKCPCVT